MEKGKMFQIAVICAFALLGYSNCAYRTTLPITLYLVRHAERPSGVDSLNEEGMKRAMELANVLERAGIKAIYVSDTRRAEQTVHPLSCKIKASLGRYDASAADDILTKLKVHSKGEKILVVGHSNTLPFILFGLGVSQDTSWIPHDQYDDLFQVLIHGKGKNQLNHLKYGKH